MITNETIQSILARRSHKSFKKDPISDDILETILTAGKYAPTGMNRQPWHFTVIKSQAGKDMFKAAATEAQKTRGPFGPGRPGGPGGPPGGPSGGPPGGPGGPMPAQGRGGPTLSDAEFRGAPALIIVSGDASSETARIDCILAMENIMIAAASFGIMSGWTHMVVKDLFPDPSIKKQFKIPEGYEVYAAAFFGYPSPDEVRDRGPRREGTVTII